MITKISKLLYLLLVPSIIAGAFNGRNEKLRDIADKTWKEICDYNGSNTGSGGFREVPWAYDATNKKYIRFGGCTTVYTNEICYFDLGTESTTFPWPYLCGAPPDRPGTGCNRGLCYDDVSKCVWSVGSASSGCRGGAEGIWKLDAATNNLTLFVSGGLGQQGHVACDTAAGKVVLIYWDGGSFKHTQIIDHNRNDTLYEAHSMPGTHYTPMWYPCDYWYAVEYVPIMNGVMQVGHMNQTTNATHYNGDTTVPVEQGWYTWFFDTQTEEWTDLQATGLEGKSYGRGILSYDPMAEVVLLLIRTASGPDMYVYTPAQNAWVPLSLSPRPPRWTEMFDYDSEHNAHMFVSYWGEVWAFRYANDPVTVQEVPSGPCFSTLRLNCHPNPFRTNTVISFGLPAPARVNLSVFDIQGRLVNALYSGTREAGVHIVPWKKTAGMSGMETEGRYIIRLESGNRSISRLVTKAD
jgi:hypothetical protein